MLAAQLVADYKADEPDIVSLVVGADDFADLIERVELVKRLQERNGEIVARVHAARDETDRAGRPARRARGRAAARPPQAVERRRNALASMRAGLAAAPGDARRASAPRAPRRWRARAPAAPRPRARSTS